MTARVANRRVQPSLHRRRARILRGVIKAMDCRYPGLGEHLEQETTVAIDGVTHETATTSRSVTAAKSSSSLNSKAVSPALPSSFALKNAPASVAHRGSRPEFLSGSHGLDRPR